jgi:hypothetical protein
MLVKTEKKEERHFAKGIRVRERSKKVEIDTIWNLETESIGVFKLQVGSCKLDLSNVMRYSRNTQLNVI